MLLNLLRESREISDNIEMAVAGSEPRSHGSWSGSLAIYRERKGGLEGRSEEDVLDEFLDVNLDENPGSEVFGGLRSDAKVLRGVHIVQVRHAVDTTQHQEKREEGHTTLHRTLKLLLTDGHSQMLAIEVTRCATILGVPHSGTKLAIRDVPIRRGTLLLMPGNIEVVRATEPLSEDDDESHRKPKSQKHRPLKYLKPAGFMKGNMRPGDKKKNAFKFMMSSKNRNPNPSIKRPRNPSLNSAPLSSHSTREIRKRKNPGIYARTPRGDAKGSGGRDNSVDLTQTPEASPTDVRNKAAFGNGAIDLSEFEDFDPEDFDDFSLPTEKKEANATPESIPALENGGSLDIITNSHGKIPKIRQPHPGPRSAQLQTTQLDVKQQPNPSCVKSSGRQKPHLGSRCGKGEMGEVRGLAIGHVDWTKPFMYMDEIEAKGEPVEGRIRALISGCKGIEYENTEVNVTIQDGTASRDAVISPEAVCQLVQMDPRVFLPLSTRKKEGYLKKHLQAKLLNANGLMHVVYTPRKPYRIVSFVEMDAKASAKLLLQRIRARNSRN